MSEAPGTGDDADQFGAAAGRAGATPRAVRVPQIALSQTAQGHIAQNQTAQNQTARANAGSPQGQPPQQTEAAAGGRSVIAFDRRELDAILRIYGRMVAAGEWRDYAIDFRADEAVFSIFRRTSEMPLYRIVKNPKLARKQGAYSVMAPGGMILKRGQDLARVLSVLEPKRNLHLVGG